MTAPLSQPDDAPDPRVEAALTVFYACDPNDWRELPHVDAVRDLMARALAAADRVSQPAVPDRESIAKALRDHWIKVLAPKCGVSAEDILAEPLRHDDAWFGYADAVRSLLSDPQPISRVQELTAALEGLIENAQPDGWTPEDDPWWQAAFDALAKVKGWAG